MIGRRTTLVRGMIVAALAAATLFPTPSAAQEPSTEGPLDDVHDQGAAVAAELDGSRPRTPRSRPPSPPSRPTSWANRSW